MSGLGTKARIDEIQHVVAAMHGMTKADLKERNRKHRRSHARFEAMYLARQLTDHSLPSIGRHFNGFDHTSILYGCRWVAARIATDTEMVARLDRCRRAIALLVQERCKAMGLTQGASSEWSPPAPLQIAKPDRIHAAIDLASWRTVGGEMEAAA